MGHSHPHRRPAPDWGAAPPSALGRLLGALRSLLGPLGRRERSGGADGLPRLPLALRRGALAQAYLSAERDADHARAGAAAAQAAERAIDTEAWWQADLWGHRALWHFEQGGMTLEAVRQARRIGDLRSAAGDPGSARRYYAEAIDEARDIGAEREQGLAALGLGRALLDLGEVTQARRLAGAAIELLDRARAPTAEVAAARGLLGTEVAVGEGARNEEEAS